MQLDPTLIITSLGSIATGVGATWVALRRDRREARGDERSFREGEQKRLLELLDKLQASQASWLRERSQLHNDNLKLSEDLSNLRLECTDLKKDIQELKKQIGDIHSLDLTLWNEHNNRAPIPILRVAANGAIMAANENFEQVFGYPESQITKMTFQEITHPDDLEADLGMVAECLSGARTRYSMSKRYRHALTEEWTAFTLHVVAHRHNGVFHYFTSYLMPIAK